MSPRPKKHRHCACPHRPTFASVYKPAGAPMTELTQAFLPADELEALHLCDGLGLTQEEAGEKMGVSRGTVQRLVSSGRKKLINAIVAGQALVVESGVKVIPAEKRNCDD
ncbi:MAG TPA: DUF134 domain-containing protein [Pelovirga sp.]|nr:DUF134 domain-containing protein [Pelovirga sp.]